MNAASLATRHAQKVQFNLQGINVHFGAHQALNNINLQIAKGDRLALIGANGSGKSTLLRCINLLSPPTLGKIWLEAEEITAPGVNQDKVRQRIGMVFQDFNLFTHLTALGNVMVGLTKVRKMHTSRRDAFHSINEAPIATVDFEGPITFQGEHRRRSAGKTIARTAMETNVTLLQFYPGMSPTVFGSVLRNSRGAVLAGTGLGLYMVKENLRNYNGHIAVQSTLGKGTTFTIRLPVAQI